MNLSYSDYTNDPNKKRQSTLGKPKLTLDSQKILTIDDIETEKQKRANRTNELLNTTATSQSEEETNSFPMGQLLPNPHLNKRTGLENNATPEPIKYNPNVREPTTEEYSNYRQIYEKPMSYIESRKPYYANMGIGSSGSGGPSNEMDKIIEKLNYMTHLLEEQKNEKTANIGEEFVLYTFLGVFMIYIVDSFSRSGKYIR
jgi:hypothetical protein